MGYIFVATRQHSKLSFLDLPSLRRIQHEIRPLVLVVGAGQGLIVAALQAQGLQCDGVDLWPKPCLCLMLYNPKRNHPRPQ